MDEKLLKKVDKHSPMPVYQQIASDLSARIFQEEWGVGDRIPSESELSIEYDASRVTVRQALAKLESEGLIEKQRGRGAFVKSNPGLVMQELYLPQIGIKHKSDIVSDEIKLSVTEQASPQIYTNLSVEQGTPLVYLERLFLMNKRTVGINRAWFPMDKVPGMAELGLVNDSITDTLQQRYGVVFSSVENYIESLMMDAAMSQLFCVVSPSPALKVNSIYFAADHSPIEYAITIWNGRDTRFHIMILPTQ